MGGKTFEDIQQYLDAARHYPPGYPTGHHWVNKFLLPTRPIHQFDCAEREGEHKFEAIDLEADDEVVFLAGHVHYALYLTQYLQEMASLPCDV